MIKPTAASVVPAEFVIAPPVNGMLPVDVGPTGTAVAPFPPGPLTVPFGEALPDPVGDAAPPVPTMDPDGAATPFPEPPDGDVPFPGCAVAPPVGITTVESVEVGQYVVVNVRVTVCPPVTQIEVPVAVIVVEPVGKTYVEVVVG